jgi:hypothetical protein
MDIQDVSRVGEYVRRLQQQKKQLQDAKQRKGQRPQNRESKQVASYNFMLAYRSEEKPDQNPMITFQNSFVPPPYLPCTLPVAELEPIFIGDLRLETNHRSTYVMLRTITPAIRMTGILALVEDEREDVSLLQLYHQDGDDTRDPNSVIGLNTVVLLKEPFFRTSGSGQLALRVDHLSDLIFLKENDPRVPAKWRPRIVEIFSAESLKLKGNTAVGKQDWWQAIKE